MAITKIQSESLNLADTYAFTGTVTGAGGVNTPAFEASLSSDQNLTNGTFTKVNFNSEAFDTDNAYDNSTNYRFTVPSGKAGKYYFYTAHYGYDGQNAGKINFAGISIYKNGSRLSLQYNDNTTPNGHTSDIYTTFVTDDASAGDYYEVYLLISNSDTGTPKCQGSSSDRTCIFGGYRIIE